MKYIFPNIVQNVKCDSYWKSSSWVNQDCL